MFYIICFKLISPWTLWWQITDADFKHIEAETIWPPFYRWHFQIHFCEWKIWILIEISLKFVPKGTIDNMQALVQVMAWHRTGDKPLLEPMVTQFNDTYMRHLLSVSSFFIEVCTSGCDWWEVLIGLDNGLALNRWQAIIWVNGNPVQWRKNTVLGID